MTKIVYQSILSFFCLIGISFGQVVLNDAGSTVTLSNGIITAQFSKTNSRLASLKLNDGVELLSPISQSMHLDSNFRLAANPGTSILKGPSTEYRTIRQETDLVELSFLWNDYNDYPFKVDIRVVMRSGQSGYYYYAIYSRDEQAPAATLEQARLVGFLNPEVFTHQAVGTAQGNRSGLMPTPQVLNAGIPYDPKEAVLLADGSVYCKYWWAEFTKDIRFIGLYGQTKGIWVISPISEWDNGGPTKQHCTTHQCAEPQLSPAIVKGFHSRHFISITDSMLNFSQGQTWEKFYGPLFIYVNENKSDLVADAAAAANQEFEQWPYQWLSHPSAGLERGSVSGKLEILTGQSAAGACVILAQPTNSEYQWQNQGKDYIRWADADSNGNFAIENVRPGNYTLYSYVGGIFGTYRHDNVVVEPQLNTSLGTLVWKPQMQGMTLWQIGTPNRSSSEFFNGSLQRSWEKSHAYDQQFPAGVSFTIGQSVESKDWHYFQPAAKDYGGFVVPVTWAIKFNIDQLPSFGQGRLTVALAGAFDAKLRIRLNGQQIEYITVSTHSDFYYQFGQSQGLYSLYQIPFNLDLLKIGSNTITLAQENAGKYTHIMYDSIKLELPERKNVDLNWDGIVNLQDIAFLAEDWNGCSLPDTEGCQDMRF